MIKVVVPTRRGRLWLQALPLLVLPVFCRQPRQAELLKTPVMDTVRTYGNGAESNSGILLSEYEVKRFSKDSTVKHGAYREWYNDGKPKTHGFYRNNRKDSIWFIYYPSGARYERRHYRNGKLNGKVIAWYKDGTKWYEGNFVDHDEISMTMWHENGKIKRKGIYEGHVVVVESCWTQTGKVIHCE